MKLMDLMVAVFVCALLLGLLVPYLAYEGGGCTRRCQCQNNLRQIGLALVWFSTQKNAFPKAGTFFDDPEYHQGDPTRSSIYQAIMDPAAFANDPGPLRSNWVVEILPYLDCQELYNVWNREESYLCPTRSAGPGSPTPISNLDISSTVIPILRCPDDPTWVPSEGGSSYAVNGGFVRWGAIPVGWDGPKVANDGVLQWTIGGRPWTESLGIASKLGVMSLGTTTGDQPWDVKTTPSSLFDGASNTLMVGENFQVGYSKGTPHSGGLPTNWACPLPNFCMFLASDDVCHNGGSTTNCLGGQLRMTPSGKDGPGWARANRRGFGEGINGVKSGAAEGSSPYVNAAHAGGANFVFCDGSVRFLNATIDGDVYAKIITPAGSKLPEPIRQTPLDVNELAR